MTDMTLRMLLTADSDQARAALRQVAGDLDRVGAEGRQAGATAAQGLGAMAGAARQAHTQAAQGARDTAQATTLAAGSVANLTAQFNDIAMMMMAGQNPLQLAIQQGTAITQVIGPMGAAGAVRALGAAFMSMLNPLNLVTIGAIAAGAAVVQWFASTGASAATAEDALDDFSASVDRYIELAERARQSTPELAKEFGDLADVVRQSAGQMAEAERQVALQRAADVLRTQAGEITSPDRFANDQARFGNPAALDVANAFGLPGAIRDNRAVIQGVMDAAQAVFQMDGTEGADQMIALITRLKDAMYAAAEASGGVNEAELERLTTLDATLRKLGEMRQAEQERQTTAESARQTDSQRAAEMAEALRREAQLRREVAIAGADTPEGRQSAREAESREMAARLRKMQLTDLERENVLLALGARQRAEIVAMIADGNRWGKAQLATLQDQVRVTEMIRAHGADSVEVTEARLSAERRVFAEMVESRGMAEWLERALMSAWDAANGVASVDMAGNISLAANEAARLADNLSRFIAMNPITADMRDEDRLMGLPVTPDAEMREQQRRAVANFQRITAPRGGGGSPGGGGGGSGAPDPGSLAALEAEAQRTLEALDLAVAGVNEKVRAGLDSTAEGAEAIADAKRRAAEALAELIPELQRANAASGPEAEAAVARWRAALDDLAGAVRDTGSEFGGLKDGLNGVFEDVIAGAIKGTAEVRELADAIVDMFARAAAQRFTDRLISPLIDSLFGMIRFADGGVPKAPAVTRYSDGGLPGLDLFRDTLVDRPTRFAMGGGKVGEMGEAGPEAILPTAPAPGGGLGVRAVGPGGAEGILGLTRIGGKLGVSVEPFADGGVPWGERLMRGPGVSLAPRPGPGERRAEPERRGGDRPLTVVINNNAAGTRVEAQERPDGAGGVNLEVIVSEIEDRIAGNLLTGRGSLGDTIGRTFGLGRVGR